MEKVKNREIINKTGPDLNGNDAKSGKKCGKGTSASPKDQIVTDDGRVFYPCQFCNKVFPIKTTRTFHIKKCPAKEYILSVDDTPETVQNDRAEMSSIPPKFNNAINSANKIAIQQNIILNKQVNVDEILAKTKSPPIKLTIRRNPSNGNEVSNHFTVSSSLILKEKNKSDDDFNSITKRIESNSVTLNKHPKLESSDSSKSESEKSDEGSETTCRKCTKEFGSAIELLRHSRKCHSYPKVLMALSEVKKFYTVKDRSECPICHKPLKTNFRSVFVKHLHTHTNEMKYSCHVCNKKFRRTDHMKAHEKRHIVKDKK